MTGSDVQTKESSWWSEDKHVYRLWRESICYSPTATISHCRRSRFVLEHFWRWRRTLLVLEMNTSGAGDEHIWRWRQTHLAQETNTFVAGDGRVLRWRYLSAGDECVETRIWTSAMHAQLATNYFQREDPLRWFLLYLRWDDSSYITSTHPPPKTSDISLSCSPLSTLSHCRYPQIVFTQ